MFERNDELPFNDKNMVDEYSKKYELCARCVQDPHTFTIRNGKNTVGLESGKTGE
jgi:hypothetical protein